jgi:hypothetical protein
MGGLELQFQHSRHAPSYTGTEQRVILREREVVRCKEGP